MESTLLPTLTVYAPSASHLIIPFNTFATQNYGPRWMQSPEDIMLKIADAYAEYWMDKTVVYLSSPDGYHDTADGLVSAFENNGNIHTDGEAAFIDTMKTYSWYEDVIPPEGTLKDLPIYIRRLTTDAMEALKDSFAPDDEFSGNWATPMAALNHYLFGDGKEMNVSIANLGLDIKPEEISVAGHQPMDELINDNSFVGTKSVVIEKFAYDTYDDSVTTGNYLGNISLKLEGEFSRYSDGSWEFVGEARSYKDIYDFNASTHRDWWAEELTNIVDEHFSGNAYFIDIQGSLPVEWHSDPSV